MKKEKPTLRFKIKTYKFLPPELVPILQFDKFEAQENCKFDSEM